MPGDVMLNAVKDEIIQSTNDGAKYVTEADLCERVGVSRTKLRESLKALDMYGMIEKRQRRGISLRKYSRDEISELFDLRKLLESHAVENTVKNATDNDLYELEVLHREIERATDMDKYVECARLDLKFHRQLISISGQKMLLKMTDGLYIIESTLKLPMINEKLSESQRDPYTHLDIIEALREHDTERYRHLLIQHIEWIKEKALKNL
jgi:DNA-binding GntR family transcriptional regulator